LLKAGYLKNVRPTIELGFENYSVGLRKLVSWNGRHQMLLGKDKMLIAHPSTPAFSNTYVSGSLFIVELNEVNDHDY